MSHETLQRGARDHLLLHFTRNGAFGQTGMELLVVERGDGPYVFDTRGRRYIDALSGLFCAQLGYSYGEEIGAAAAQQLTRLGYNSLWGTAHPAAIELAVRLAGLAPGCLDHVFFTSGGSEAVETAWKLARQYHIARGEPGRRKAIARDIAYHGVSLGALALTGVERFKEPFGTPAIETRHISAPNAYREPHGGAGLCERLIAELEAVVQEEGPESVAMIIAEPVQNAGGCLVAPDGYWAGVREIADRHGILVVADEVITGFGRLGDWLASARYDIRPDIVTVAKGLTAGYAPMGAVLVSDQVAAPLYSERTTLLHGLTWGGHPIAAATALKTLDIFERERVLDNVRALEPRLHANLESLRELPIVGDVRGAGFFWAIELVAGPDGERFGADEQERLVRGYLPSRLKDAGLIARPDDRGDVVLQIAPPLISDAALLDEIVERLTDVLHDAGQSMGLSATRFSATA